MEAYTTRDSSDATSVNFIPNKFPTLARFAADIGVGQKTLSNWYRAVHPETHPNAGELAYPEWRTAYEACKSKQESLLIEGTMCGAYNAAFASKVAVNLMQWKDKVDIELKAEIKADIQSITADMTAEDAAIAYAKLLKADDE